jgi:hypothetical protein
MAERRTYDRALLPGRPLQFPDQLYLAHDGVLDHGRMQWPGAYCEQTRAGCCKPTTGVSPARDFYITGLTVYNATTDAAVTECSNQAPYNPNLVHT